MKKSKFLSLSLKDLAKGFILAVLVVVITGLYGAITATPPHFPTGAEWATLGYAGLAAGIAYLLKNFFTNSDDKFLKKE